MNVMAQNEYYTMMCYMYYNYYNVIESAKLILQCYTVTIITTDIGVLVL